MNGQGVGQLVVFVVVLIAVAYPRGLWTLRAEGLTLVTLLIGLVVLTSGLLILPALTLGPIVEGLAH